MNKLQHVLDQIALHPHWFHWTVFILIIIVLILIFTDHYFNPNNRY